MALVDKSRLYSKPCERAGLRTQTHSASMVIKGNEKYTVRGRSRGGTL